MRPRASGMRARASRGAPAIVVAALLAAVPVPGPLAQQAPTPGAVRESLTPPPKPPSPAPGRAVEVEPPPRAGVPPGGPAIPVRRFELIGNSAIPTEELRALLRPWEGTSLTLLQIYEVADRLSRYYREQGYLLATVTVPPQKVSTGVVRLEVIEGELEAIRVEGNRRYSTGWLLRELEPLRPGEPVRGDRLETEMLLLNDLPGLSASAVVKPGKAFGTSDVVVRARERLIEGSLRLNNYGRESIGTARLEAQGVVNNPLRLGDRLRLTWVQSESASLRYGAVEYGLAVGSRGTRLTGSFSRFLYEVETEQLGGAFVGSALSGNGLEARVELRHPFLRTRRQSLWAGLGFSHRKSNQNGRGALALAQDDVYLNTGEIFALWTHSAGRATTSLSATFASNGQSNPDGQRNNAQRGKFTFDLAHLRPLPWWDLTFFARINAGLAFQSLMDIERYRLGGPGSVRAYPSAEVAGDQGYLLQLQLNRRWDPVPGVPTTWRVFFDGGRVFRKRPAAGETDSAGLSGAGVGFTSEIRGRYRVDFEYVRTTSARTASDGREDSRFWVQVSARY